ncbi:MAG TPA: single-stranded-DNA-specific exonuclease RecJ [Methylophilaceae bacterium]|nr:single-stranded-DNA-specific exonuclease RecJ [Methylophilaceae bacterium]
MIKIKTRSFSSQEVKKLSATGLHPLLAKLLVARGVQAEDALDTSLKHLMLPNLLTNNDRMAQILADAIQADKKILVVGDYDADGATATAVAVKGLRTMGAQVDFLVPNRFEYGYGLTPEIVVLAKQHSPDYILTVDNGIASIEGVAFANNLGIQVLVTDHHLPAEQVPEALCIVNPNQHGCGFPSKNLAGVGVMFYVLMALRAELKLRGVFHEDQSLNLAGVLDLVALGTVADLVKLDANNRILVEQGLRRIRAEACCEGIKAILHWAGRSIHKATAQDLGFYVGPRLNAAGRLDDMTLGIRCLLAETSAEAMHYAQQLHELNAERRSIESEMQVDALQNLDINAINAQVSISIYQPDWHQGVIGILASRIKEQYHRPVIAFASARDGLLKGSGRSIPGLHLRDALDLVTKQHPQLIVKFGGHAMAAGLTIKETDFDVFKSVFEHVVKSLINEEDLRESIETDGQLEAPDITLETARLLENQVWGQGFPTPLFYDEFKVVNQRVLGDKHLKLLVEKQQKRFEAIYFNQPEFLSEHIHIVYQLQVNAFNGQQTVQLQIKHAHA